MQEIKDKIGLLEENTTPVKPMKRTVVLTDQNGRMTKFEQVLK
jgi:hypothetical protein